jgi:hypothetical protein
MGYKFERGLIGRCKRRWKRTTITDRSQRPGFSARHISARAVPRSGMVQSVQVERAASNAADGRSTCSPLRPARPPPMPGRWAAQRFAFTPSRVRRIVRRIESVPNPTSTTSPRGPGSSPRIRPMRGLLIRSGGSPPVTTLDQRCRPPPAQGTLERCSLRRGEGSSAGRRVQRGRPTVAADWSSRCPWPHLSLSGSLRPVRVPAMARS